MIPVLNEIIENKDFSFFRTTDNVIGLGFELECCDLESNETDSYNHKILSLIRSLPTNALARVKVKIESDFPKAMKNSRSSALEELGFVRRRCAFLVELGSSDILGLNKIKLLFSKNAEIEKSIKSLYDIKSLVEQSGLLVKPLSKTDLKMFFPDPNGNWVKTSHSVSNGKSHIGVVRLTRLKSEPLDQKTLATLFVQSQTPVEISVSFRRVDSGKAKLDLERRLKQTKNQDDPTTKALQDSTVKIIQDSLSSGAQIVEFEFLVLIERMTAEELTSDLKKVENLLNQFADFKVETFGVTASWLATILSNNMHVPIKELDETFTSFLPVWTFGESRIFQDSSRGLPLLREDKSLYNFDLFDSGFSVFNSVIIGTSGKGKSVLTGMLSQALLNDPSISMIKLDVGGSHSKECQLFGGSEYLFQLDRPSGINPFEMIKSELLSESDKIGILSRFISVLIQEQGEGLLSKDLRSRIEENVCAYLNLYKNPSLQDFFDQMHDFPRRNLLKRWVTGGVYENAFALADINKTSNRLRYYNFSQIFQASDPEFAQAGIAAVLAQFNFESLVNSSNRIVLVCDETPFFIKSCFDFFKFTTANVRKYGHSVILITQLSSDLIVNDDTGIIENSPQRFLFSVDGDPDKYRRRFQLSENQIQVIKGLKSIPKQFSEVFLQTSEFSKKLRVKITPEEYWKLTSSKQDNQKIEKLLCAVPELSLKEALKCLAAV